MSSVSDMETRRREDPGCRLPDGTAPSPQPCVARENTISRRLSASNLQSFREEVRLFGNTARSFSCTAASSPGYAAGDQIDPSTYSFSAALKALQARSVNGWDYLTSSKSLNSDGNGLKSKWDEAEKYICNPLSGEFPVECLSAKTLSGRIIHTSNRFTKSGPLLFSQASLVQMRPNFTYDVDEASSTAESGETGPRKTRRATRDVGIQSILSESSSISSNSSPDSTQIIKESSITSCYSGGSVSFTEKSKQSGPEVIEEKQRTDKRRDKARQKCRFGRCLAWSHGRRKSKGD